LEARQAFVFQGMMNGKGSANPGRATPIMDVGLIFVAKIAQGGKDRIRGRLAKAAKRHILKDTSPFLESLNVAILALALARTIEDLEHFTGTHTAGRTFPAGFVFAEVHEKASHVHHAFVLIHDDHATGAHDRP
jgi:hypothetical protein